MPPDNNPKAPRPDLPGDSDPTEPEILTPIRHNREDSTPANRLSDELREEVALEALRTGNLAATARKFGLNTKTVHIIAQEFFDDAKEFQNMRLANELEDISFDILKRLKLNIDRLAPSQLPVAAGICLDKRALLAGKRTSGTPDMTLRIAWQNGSGAVELRTDSGREDDR